MAIGIRRKQLTALALLTAGMTGCHTDVSPPPTRSAPPTVSTAAVPAAEGSANPRAASDDTVDSAVPDSSAPHSGAPESGAPDSAASDGSVRSRPDSAAAPADDVPGPSRPDEARTGAPADAGETVEIIFDDIQLPIQADMVYRPFMLTDRVKELDGRRVRIHGYMLPDSRTKGIKQFVLLKNTECKFGPGGQADHLINVLMVDGVTTKYQDQPITIEGTLKVNPFAGPDGNTWSIYDLACEQVELYKPRR